MILGQSAGTAAVVAMDEGIVVQDVDYTKLKARLLVINRSFRAKNKVVNRITIFSLSLILLAVFGGGPN